MRGAAETRSAQAVRFHWQGEAQMAARTHYATPGSPFTRRPRAIFARGGMRRSFRLLESPDYYDLTWFLMG
jgi:hypothetical protein